MAERIIMVAIRDQQRNGRALAYGDSFTVGSQSEKKRLIRAKLAKPGYVVQLTGSAAAEYLNSSEGGGYNTREVHK